MLSFRLQSISHNKGNKTYLILRLNTALKTGVLCLTESLIGNELTVNLMLTTNLFSVSIRYNMELIFVVLILFYVQIIENYNNRLSPY